MSFFPHRILPWAFYVSAIFTVLFSQAGKF